MIRPAETEATIRTARLLLRPFRESDHGDLYEFLSQLKDDEFEGYPGITFESCLTQLRERVGSAEYYAIELPGHFCPGGFALSGARDPAAHPAAKSAPFLRRFRFDFLACFDVECYNGCWSAIRGKQPDTIPLPFGGSAGQEK